MSDLKQASLMLERGQPQLAFPIFSAALDKTQDNGQLIYDTGLCFMQGLNYGLAILLFERAFEMTKDPGILQDLGYCYRRIQRPDKALEVWRQALEMPLRDRKRSEILGNIAGCYASNGTPEEAIKLYKEALRVWPGNASIGWNVGLVQLEARQWKDGFLNYHNGFLPGGPRHPRLYPKVDRNWKPGDSFKGKSVIVWGDQGIGDEIMFTSCLPDLIAEARSVKYDCHPRLAKLFSQSFGIECHGTRKTAQADWLHETHADLSVPVSSLTIPYRSNGEFPRTPFLKANPIRSKSGKRRVGISWEGGTAENNAHLRSIRLKEWTSLLRVLQAKDVEFFSLQYTEGAPQEICAFEELTGIHVSHFPGIVQNEDYSVTADFVAGLDLVISVCTSVIHLAGALGVQCWCLVPSRPAWRYTAKGPMPWYESVKLYRQENDDWGPVFQQLEADLADF